MHDISKIKDPTVLKAMAYDEIAKKEQAELNLSALNQQLSNVLAEAVALVDPPKQSEPLVAQDDIDAPDTPA